MGQAWLLPPSVHDLVPAGMRRRDLVHETLDLAAIMAGYPEDRGQPPYHPAMMTALLLDAYSRGIHASRRIAVACVERMAVSGMQRPDFQRLSQAPSGGAGRAVRPGAELVPRSGFGEARPGCPRRKVNASKHKAMSYGRMVPAAAALAAEVAGWLAAAEAADAADAAALGADRRGDELPDWVAAKALRLARIREAKAALQAQAQAAADAGKPAAADPAPSPRRGRPPRTPPGTPEAKAQRNFTAPDSRIMKTKDGFIQGSNGQAAVAGGQQAHGLTNSGSDQGQLTPLLDAIRTNTGRQPKEVSAAAGYGSEANLEALEERAIRGSIATGRQRHGQAAATGPIASMGRQHGPRLRAMRQRLQRGGLRSRCASRSSPVRSSRPGASASSCCGAWPRSGALICTAHNLLKLTRALA